MRQHAGGRQFGLVVALAFLCVSGCQTGRKGTDNQVNQPQPFVAENPEQLPMGVLEEHAIKSRESLIFGRVVDPIGAAIRTSRLWPLISKESSKQGLLPQDYAGLIYLESGGQQFAVSPVAAGVAQMVPRTARSYGLYVNEAESKRLRTKRTRALRILRDKRQRLNQRVGRSRVKTQQAIASLRRGISRVEAKLARVDERFNTQKAIAAGARYLGDHLDDYGRSDWAIASYHAGSGNVQSILRRYVSGYLTWEGSAKATIKKHGLSWSQVVFDVTPSRHPRTYELLRVRLGDQTWDYPWRVKAAARAMVLWRRKPGEFRRQVAFYKSPAVPRRWQLAQELIWFPPNDTRTGQWTTWKQLEKAYRDRNLVRMPYGDADFTLLYGLKLASMGDFSGPEVPKWVYTLLRPEATGLLYYLASRVRQESRDPRAYLKVTSMVRSVAYQRLLRNQRLSPDEYSCHCTGYSFDLAVPDNSLVRSRLEHELWDLRYRGVALWYLESPRSANRHYHITVSPARGEVFAKTWLAAQSHYRHVLLARRAAPSGREPTFRFREWYIGAAWALGIVWLLFAGFMWLALGSDKDLQGRSFVRFFAALLSPIIGIWVLFDRRKRKRARFR